MLEDERERTEVRMEAARWLADRGFGRAHVPVDAKQPETIVIISPTMSRLQEGMEAQQRKLEPARPALPPGIE